ncbi:MAG TPA: hypothetical protein VF286_06950 [Acidiphilium sp.]
MRQSRLFSSFALLAGVLGACALTPPAMAQVTVNPQALQQLSGTAPAAPRPATPHSQAQHVIHRTIHREARRRAVSPPLPLPPPIPPLPEIASAAIAPPPPAPAPKPKPEPHAITLVFAATASALQADQSHDIIRFVGTSPDPTARYVIQATAPGVANDPSIARRLSLDRGQAVQGALRQAGIDPERIIVQALGDPPGIPDNRAVLTELP